MATEYHQKMKSGKTFHLSAPDHSALVMKVLAFRQLHHLPRADHGATYNDVLASTRGAAASAAPKPPRLHLSDLIKASTSAIKNALGIHTTQEEMDRRVAICKNCPRKSGAAGCYG